MTYKVLRSLFGVSEDEIKKLIKTEPKVRNSLWLEALFNKELSFEELKSFPEDQIRLACGFAKDYGYLFDPNPQLLRLCKEKDKADRRYLRKFFEVLNRVHNPTTPKV